MNVRRVIFCIVYAYVGRQKSVRLRYSQFMFYGKFKLLHTTDLPSCVKAAEVLNNKTCVEKKICSNNLIL